MAALSNQFAVVTGAGSGIGKAIAQALGAHGAIVALVGRTKTKLDATAAGFDTKGPRPVVLPADLSMDEQLDSLIAEVQRRFKQVDVLGLCAGEIAHGPVESAPVADFDKLYRANVRANYRLISSLHLTTFHLTTIPPHQPGCNKPKHLRFARPSSSNAAAGAKRACPSTRFGTYSTHPLEIPPGQLFQSTSYAPARDMVSVRRYNQSPSTQISRTGNHIF